MSVRHSEAGGGGEGGGTAYKRAGDARCLA